MILASSDVPGPWAPEPPSCSSRLGLVTASCILISELPPHALPAPFKLDPTVNSTISRTLALFSWLGPDWFSGDWRLGHPALTDQHGHKEQGHKSASPQFQPLEDLCLTFTATTFVHNHFISSSPWRKKASTADLNKCNLKLWGS